MKTRLTSVLSALALGGALVLPALGQTAPAPADFAHGEVRKVDKPAGKITLKHGEIKNLDMPPMTMAFAVADKALLERVKVGDKVRFRAVDDNGRLTVTELQSEQ